MGELSLHFSWWEFEHSAVAARLGLDNRISEELRPNAEALALNVLEPARLALGPIRINSGYRAPLVNWHVRHPGIPPPAELPQGGQHPLGRAADLRPFNCSVLRLMAWLLAFAPFDQLIYEFEAWVHVSYVSVHPRQQALVSRIGEDGGTVYREARTGEFAL